MFGADEKKHADRGEKQERKELPDVICKLALNRNPGGEDCHHQNQRLYDPGKPVNNEHSTEEIARFLMNADPYDGSDACCRCESRAEKHSVPQGETSAK